MLTVSKREECYQFTPLSHDEREAQVDFTMSCVATLPDVDVVTIYYNWLRCSSPQASGTLLQPRPYGGDSFIARTWATRGRTLLTKQDEGSHVAEFRRFARLYGNEIHAGSSPYSLKWFISFWRGDDVLHERNKGITTINVLPRPISSNIPPLSRATPALKRGDVVCAARIIVCQNEGRIQAGQLGRVESKDEYVCIVQFSEHLLVVCLWSMLLVPVAPLPRKWLPPPISERGIVPR